MVVAEQADPDAGGALVLAALEVVGSGESLLHLVALPAWTVRPPLRPLRSGLPAASRTRRRPAVPRYRPRARQACRRCATSISSRSPTSWPRVSLSVLKLSRSRNRIAPQWPLRVRSCQRLAQPVLQQAAVGQLGQRVVIGQAVNLGLRLRVLRDIGISADVVGDVPIGATTAEIVSHSA